MEKYKFEIMPQSWFKRRTPREIPPTLLNVEISGFEKTDNMYCEMYAEFDNGEKYHLKGRISSNVLYTVGKPPVIKHWTVQGINNTGVSVLVKLIEK